MKGTKAEQTINSEEMSVAHAEWAGSRERVRMTGVRLTAFLWVCDRSTGGCLLLKYGSAVFLFYFYFFLM